MLDLVEDFIIRPYKIAYLVMYGRKYKWYVICDYVCAWFGSRFKKKKKKYGLKNGNRKFMNVCMDIMNLNEIFETKRTVIIITSR